MSSSPSILSEDENDKQKQPQPVNADDEDNENNKTPIKSEEARDLIESLLKKRNSEIDSPEFKRLTILAQQEHNRKPLLMADVHIVLNEYYSIYRDKPESRVVLRVVEILAQEAAYNYTLAVNAFFLPNLLTYFEGCVDTEVPQKVLDSLSEEQRVSE